jgi:aminopeptidase N
MMRQAKPKAILLKDYRPTPFLVEHVRLTFRLDTTNTRIKAEIRFRPNPAHKGKARKLVLDGEMIALHRVALNGRALSADQYQATDTQLLIASAPRRAFDLVIETSCNPSANTALSGLYISNGVYCTQCEAEGFRRISYFYDRPDVMTRYFVRIEAPQDIPVLLSNGNPASRGAIAETDYHFAEWEDPHPKPSYLFALVAGNLATVKDSFTTMDGRQVTLGIYVEKGKEDRCGWAMQSLKAAMGWDEKVFKRAYDLDVFNIVAVSDFNMGAMENKGLNIFNDKYILALPETATDTDFELIEAIIAHEYFHNWTGNRITCRDWFQLCLKEGLTVFRDQEFTSDLRSRAVKRIEDVQDLRARQFPEDMGPLQHPARPASYIEINNFYTATVYEKGAELCRMMKTLIGHKAFAKAMQLYFKRHDGKAATVEDFVACMADAAGHDLKVFFRWYEQAGTPVVRVEGRYDAARRTYHLSLAQKVKRLRGQPAKKPLHMPIELGLIGPDGIDLKLKLRGKSALKTPMIELSRAKQEYIFGNVPNKPVLSLNRGFSAPIIVQQNYNAVELLSLIAHDSDSFNRWEAAQVLSKRLIVDRYGGKGRKLWSTNVLALARALETCLKDLRLDDAFKAKMLELPDFEELSAAVAKDIDAEKLFVAREALRRAVAEAMDGTLQKVFAASVVKGPYAPDAASVGKRALHFAVLALVTAGDATWAADAIAREFETAHNMTVEFGALRLGVRLDEKTSGEMLARFYQKHAGDHLLVDKWFAAQALIPDHEAAERVRQLMQHKAFTLKTPNRVYALLRNFIGGNFRGFHAASGKGYDLAAEMIIALDAINPQVASRLATGFRTWRMFDVARRAKAQGALRKILQTPDLSRDVYEIISRTLKA